jgi:hypothetical protein
VLVKLGTLEQVTYKTRKGGDPTTYYTHDFAEDGGRRPVLAMDADSRKLHIVGGTYKITRHGIEG